MKATFLNHQQPLLTMLFSVKTAEEARRHFAKGLEEGAEAFCIQTCALELEARNEENFRKLFNCAEGKPIYVTNYRGGVNEGTSDEQIAEGLLMLARSGATLCDVMGDMFDRQPGEMTDSPEAVVKQMELIRKLKEAGAEVLMSSHVCRFISAEEVLDIALRQQSRGADIVKIVTGAETIEEQLENLRITALLKKELKVPYLFLSGGQCNIHRRIGPELGCCMYLCSLDDSVEPKPIQPMLRKVKAIRDNFR